MPHYADLFDPEAAFTAAIEATERTVAALRERAAAGDCSADDTEGRQKISETITYLRNKENQLHYDTALVKGRPMNSRAIPTGPSLALDLSRTRMPSKAAQIDAMLGRVGLGASE
jgi:hypothetical protein